MITGNQKFLVSVRCDKGRAFRIVSATGKKLQSQKRMCSSAFPEIDLDGVGFPWRGVVRAGDDKVYCETADDASISQKVSDFRGVLSDGNGVGRIGGKDAAEIALSRRTA